MLMPSTPSCLNRSAATGHFPLHSLEVLQRAERGRLPRLGSSRRLGGHPGERPQLRWGGRRGGGPGTPLARSHACMQTVPFAVKVIKANQKETFVHTYTTVKSDVQRVTATSPRACLKFWSWDVLILFAKTFILEILSSGCMAAAL